MFALDSRAMVRHSIRATGRAVLLHAARRVNTRSAAFFIFMYILYVDESGDGGTHPSSSRHLVLSGAAMHEGQWRRLTTALDAIQRAYFPQAGSNVEFHASDLRAGRNLYRNMPAVQRTKLMNEVYEVISSSRQGLTLFAAIIEKQSLMYKYNGRVGPYDRAFEGLCTMFNYFLQRMQKHAGNVLKGVVVFDEARPSLSKQIRSLLAQFQAGGTRWATMTNLIETAFFFDSRNSRIMQIADFCSYAVFRWYEAGHDTYLQKIEHKFDREGQKIHGLKCYPLECTKPYPVPAKKASS